MSLLSFLFSLFVVVPCLSAAAVYDVRCYHKAVIITVLSLKTYRNWDGADGVRCVFPLLWDDAVF